MWPGTVYPALSVPCSSDTGIGPSLHVTYAEITRHDAAVKNSDSDENALSGNQRDHVMG